MYTYYYSVNGKQNLRGVVFKGIEKAGAWAPAFSFF